VCESVLFGAPLTLRPTACWRLDWEELERNQQAFAALCHSLQQKGKYLLAVTDHPELRPRFLVLPSPAPSLGLLIKSVAVQELMMPTEVSVSEDQPSPEAAAAVQHCLDTLELRSSYNPLMVRSNLYSALSVSKRGSLSRGPRAFTPSPHPQNSVRGRDARSLGPRKQYSSYSGK
jgi:hypothetical protein